MKANSFNLPAFVMSGLLVLGIGVLAFWIVVPRTGDALDGYSVDRLYNQGNTYAHSGKTGLAVLNYERALVLAPADADVRANLHWVRDHAGLAAPAPTLLDRMAANGSPNVLAYAGSLGLLLIGATLLMGRTWPQGRWISRGTLAGGVALIVLASTNAAATWPKLDQAVVTSAASARISPVTTGDVSFKLSEGDIVSVEAEYHDFALIKTDETHSGWILSSELSRIVPADDGHASVKAKS